MVLEAVRIVADWLEDSQYGVNAEIANLDLDDGDSPPGEVVSVLDATRSGTAARGEKAADWPVLIVAPGGPFEMQGEVAQTHRQANALPITVGYINEDGEDEHALRDTEYTLRAVQMSVRELMRNANSASRTRNGVTLLIAQRFIIDPLPTQLESGLVVNGTITIEFTARDASP